MRTKITQAKNIVIKIGTSSISYPNGRLNFQKIKSFVDDIGNLHQDGKNIILVSSGAIGVGAGKMGLSRKPERLSEKQALAAIGQAELINIYRKFFKELSINVGQVLLTKDIINNEITAKNAQNTLQGLIAMGIIPIINENDTVSTEEILIGDNDSLSAEVAILSQSELLIILSDIDGLYSEDPHINPDAMLIKQVHEITNEIEKLSKGKGSAFGTGGMQTKIAAAKKCLNKDIQMIIAKFEAKILQDIFKGEEIGTLFSK
ncbi:MAG: glutamate 5-kinase [Bacteroidales bacterium]|nr:glutamate 5-kinase [Bacteroidales bacterium]